jgi:YbbR domain-containing protein
LDKWLSNTNFVRILALCIGVLLWVVVHLDVQSNTPVSATDSKNTVTNVMVQALYDEAQYSIVSIEPAEVTVTMKGDAAKIKQMNPGNFKLVTDLSKLTAGTYELPVTTESELLKGVTLEIVPNKVKVVMEEKKMKEVPVQIDLSGQPAAGFRAGTPVMNPNRVYISGPASKIEGAESARATISVDGANQNVVKKVKLTAYDKAGNEVKGTISPPVLEVEVPITLPVKAMPLQIKWTGQPASGYAVSAIAQSVEQVNVYGTQDLLDKMEFYDGVEIDLNGLREDKVFSLEIPVKNKSLRVEPAKLEVKVTVVPSVTKTLEGIPLTLSTPPANVDVRLTAPASGLVSITVEGAPAIIDRLRLQDVTAQANVGNLSAGSYELPINVSLPQFVKRLDGTKAAVEVTAKAKPETSPAPTPTPTPMPVQTTAPPTDVPASASVQPSATVSSSPTASPHAAGAASASP